MSELPPGFQLDTPPSGFRLDNPPSRPKRGRVNLDPYSGLDITDRGSVFTATGEAVDGDTIRLNNNLLGRLFGVDAFEKGQMGYRPGQPPVNLGQMGTETLSSYIRPSQPAFGTGKESYNRPVVTLGNGWADPVRKSLLSGTALAAPDFMGADPTRRARYLEDERLARLNRQGAHQTEYMSPDIYRSAKRWNQKLRPDEEMVWSSEVPELKPDLKRLTNEQEADYFSWLSTQYGKPDFGQADLDAYWKQRGFKGSAPADEKFFDAIRKGQRIGTIDYSGWDAQALRDFKLANGFAGLRPEVQQAYNAVLSDPKADANALQQFADVNGLTFDPRDVDAFFKARARGENPNVPIPIIDPGDGAWGAAGRGLADPFGIIDETGGAIDAVAPAWLQGAIGGPTNRETIWNSDRGFGDVYENNTRQNRAIIDFDETRHPFARAGGQLASGLLLPYGGGVRSASGLAKLGAAEGAVYGFGSGDGTLGQRLANVPLNAAAGGVLGGALGKGGELLSPLLGRAGRLLGRGEAEPVAPPAGFELDAPATPAANMDAEAMPALSSPRLRDVLDVNANRPTRLLDGPTDAMMRAATARVEPGDVLPRPANEATAEDMAALGRGPYQDVTAPRERDYLETQQYPSARNPDVMVNRRGPADLVTFARAQGGLRDEGGELAASGITNAPRKGEDFTGGENRLGRLVDQERGLPVEDMAQRAYNEGYFPELDRPPTNQEFLAALDDTYRGVGRRFRPEDEGQIQAFEGARDQRYAVERARQEGAPLAQDVGQPATLDDVIANTPPATAYDDWANAVVSKVGNVRVDKLETPQDIGQALKIADNVAGGFDASRRGKISFAETQALAQDLGMTADDLLARRKGQAFSAEEAYSARVILAKSGNELVNMAKRIRSLGDDPGSEALAMFRKALVRHTAIQEAVSGMTAEAGRALSAFRMAADSRDLPGRVLEGLASAGGGAGRLKDAADRILDLAQDPANLNRFVEKVSKPTFADRAQEIWYNYLLSGPQTHMVNILSNTMTALGQLPEHAVAAGVGAARKAFKRDEADRVLFGELGARAVGLLQGTKEGLREFGRAFRTGETADFVTKMESQTQKAVPGIKGEILRVPTRLLTAEDELFKAMARRMELAGLAVRQAGKEGLKGQAAKERAAELLADPTDAMMEKALDYGRYVTFQRPLGDGPAGGLSRITQNHPYLKAVLPFVRTPTNLIKFTAERSPLAPMVKEWRKDFAAGGARRDLALAKVMVGSGIGAMIAELARDGVITGSEPSDQNKRRLLLANGWQPYSIKIGDTYYSYKRLDPFAMTFGTAADIATMGDDVPTDEMDQNAFLWVASVMSNFASRTWLSGITDALDALKDPERYSGNFIKRLVGSATVPTGAAQLARVIDPTMREAPDIGSYMQSRMPGRSDELLPKRDVWGQPIVSEGGVGPDIISPIWTSTDRKDPVTQEALRVGATVSPPKIGDMTPQQFDRLQPIVGNLARKWIGELMASPDYRAMDRETQAEEISRALAAARKAAKAHVVGGEPLNAERPERKRKGGRSSPPAGFQVDPLPDGFVLDRR